MNEPSATGLRRRRIPLHLKPGSMTTAVAVDPVVAWCCPCGNDVPLTGWLDAANPGLIEWSACGRKFRIGPPHGGRALFVDEIFDVDGWSALWWANQDGGAGGGGGRQGWGVGRPVEPHLRRHGLRAPRCASLLRTAPPALAQG